MQRFVCIHGHFYQPPRKDPWTGRVEQEGSANPFHDWNERITAECYLPNAVSPILDGQGKLVELMNNYSWISFDFGPTLLGWLESRSSEPYESIIDADRVSSRRFGGHGSALAQVYNHMIMPLASPAEKRTQVRWGVEDFERRFGRYPEGMWLPETAVDLDTMEALAESEVKFTILSPHQASFVKGPGQESWTDVSGGRVDSRRAYSCSLPSGRRLSVFFYDRAISRDIAFGNLLASADSFASRLLGGFSDSSEPQLVNVASDGETYGHHHGNGHSSLSACVSRLERGKSATMANYGLFLHLFPPIHEVKIIERSSWSCPHGVERWRSNCGCGSEIRPGYNQEWRTPLRGSLDWLQGRLAEIYQVEGGKLFLDPSATRDQLPTVPFERREELLRYLLPRFKEKTTEGQRLEGEKLVEMLGSSALMFASCAWFWEDITRIEAVQSLKFAAKAIEVARELTGRDLEPEFESILAQAKPNDTSFKTGRDLYRAVARK